MVNTTILWIMNPAIAGLQDPRGKISELWGCEEELNGDSGLYARNVAPNFLNNTAAGWEKAVMKLSNPMLLCVVYRGQQADGTAGAQTPISGGCSYFALYDILPPPAEDMIEDMGEEVDDDDEMWRLNARSFTMTKTRYQKFQRKLQNRIVRL